MASPLRSKSGASSTLAAFIVGLPAGIGLVWLLTVGPLRSDQSERYLHHPVEKVELIMFCAAMAALGAKWLGSLFQKAGLRAEILPAWDGKAVPVSHAAQSVARQRGGPALVAADVDREALLRHFWNSSNFAAPPAGSTTNSARLPTSTP